MQSCGRAEKLRGVAAVATRRGVLMMLGSEAAQRAFRFGGPVMMTSPWWQHRHHHAEPVKCHNFTFRKQVITQ
jgi:hypothetical protein